MPRPLSLDLHEDEDEDEDEDVPSPHNQISLCLLGSILIYLVHSIFP